MKNSFPSLNSCQLFNEIPDAELTAMLQCLSSVQRNFTKDSFISTGGEEATSIGIVLSGAVHVVRDDYWGTRMILTRIEPGGIFGESFACVGGQWPVSTVAAEDSEILLLDGRRILTTCSSACAHHSLMIKNLASSLAQKNVNLTQRMELLTLPTTRAKLVSYLTDEARKFGSNRFTIPFKRQQLAEYLAVDRSALSRAITKLRVDKLVRCRRSDFVLLIDGEEPLR
ncbi:MAG: Crp/Fnr family transcriptional regulator [Polyangiaceae bacterium]|nr:Crp/Fnr family transcriptional regulator [Polyangiaceae bacterium]